VKARPIQLVVLLGGVSGLLIAAMRVVEYRFLVIDHSIEIYGAIVALAFASVGIWLGQYLTRPRVVVKEVAVEVPVEVRVPVAGPFVLDAARIQQLGITPRELEVLQLIAEGLSTREMADRLCVSENTVKTHCSRVFDKLGVNRRTQAVQAGKRLGLLP
jgi:NarL family two-component system response regulator LiaR